MSKIFFFVLVATVGSVSFAAEQALYLPESISFVTSKDGPYEAKYSNAVRYRMTVNNPVGGEGSQKIIFEKFASGRYGTPDKIIFKKEVVVTDLPKIKEFVDNIAKKSVEATYGCCGVSNVSWSEYQVKFQVQRENKSFACETTEFTDGKFKVTCKE
ncbi:hypothetical protein [Bdellovibrio sp. HCB337]|uniref:hypothetical protein n=1 Tax=Bdellovibrio sp. HCB337 TaxID=3394358 RepID=UPI0039A5D71F